ncbi:DUF1737 domain-containing protein [Alphaproteobacteria bacterium]|nr:DUF1737 domain-containing protein [Alphaproteobacteria bacterium]MDC0148677.1 DUF1737 domain-containing protein [Alphaproteobacteria bacterium]
MSETTDTAPRKAYKFITGIDDEDFCQRVSVALRSGYVLHGAPIMQVDAQGIRHCGQSVVLQKFALRKGAARKLATND